MPYTLATLSVLWQAENTFLQLFLYLHDIFSAMDTLKTIRLPKHHDDLH
jgi:hypothetical protein